MDREPRSLKWPCKGGPIPEGTEAAPDSGEYQTVRLGDSRVTCASVPECRPSFVRPRQG
jgi:hypothetical protein